MGEALRFSACRRASIVGVESLGERGVLSVRGVLHLCWGLGCVSLCATCCGVLYLYLLLECYWSALSIVLSV